MIPKIIIFIILINSFINSVYSIGVNGITNYNFKLKGIERYEDLKNQAWDLKDIKLKKLNKTHFAINGIYSVLRDDIPENDLMMSFHAAQKKSNGYAESALIQLNNRSYCDLWNNEQLIFPNLKQCINVTNYNCPPEKGYYTLTNYIPDTSKLPPNLPEGPWRFTFEYFDKDVLVSGYKVYAEITKESAMG